MLLAFAILGPALLGTLAFFWRSRRALALLVTGASLHLLAAAALWMAPPAPLAGEILVLDEVGLLFLTLTSVLFFAASLAAVAHFKQERETPLLHRFVGCLLWFLSAMTLVVSTHHLGVMWAAVEATTIASAPLVYSYKRKAALEAAWKYLMICSVGIALALLGVFFLGVAASRAGRADLGLSALLGVAPSMERPWLKAAFVLALVGFGTKMGLAPLHTWLPDTHSEAPSPVSALLSGALLNCAFLAILRFYQVAVASGDAAFARTMLLLLGFVSIGVAAAFMIAQRNYKRLLAYSSIENMGIIAVGIGLGGGATYGALLHSVNHSLCKAGLFFLAGNVLGEFHTTAAGEVRGVLRRLPATGTLLAALAFALGGAPPFGTFLSKFVILQTAFASGHPWLGALFLLLMSMAFLGFAGVILPMLQGDTGVRAKSEPILAVAAPLALALGALLMGTWIPPALADLLRRAAQTIGG
jgi:hydrogenase-4 component F